MLQIYSCFLLIWLNVADLFFFLLILLNVADLFLFCVLWDPGATFINVVIFCCFQLLECCASTNGRPGTRSGITCHLIPKDVVQEDLQIKYCLRKDGVLATG